TYYNPAYNGSAAAEAAANRLVSDMAHQNKYLTGICHGVSALAWARVDGVSPLAGHTVSAYALSAPGFVGTDGHNATVAERRPRREREPSGATRAAARWAGTPFTAADEVRGDGRIITAENFDSASLFGQVIAQRLRG